LKIISWFSYRGGGNMGKVNTGISGLDTLLYGGIVQGNCVLVEGVPGAGKTTFGLEFIYRGITEFNEPGVVITFEQFPQQMYHDALNFGWDLKELEKRDKLRIICTSPEVMLDAGFDLVNEVISEVGAKRVLVDSITHFGNIIKDPLELRRAVYSFCNGLKRLGLTSFLVKEIEDSGNQRVPFEEYVVDAVIRLTNAEGLANRRNRFVEVLKTRGQKHISGKHPFKIEDNLGIRIFALKAHLSHPEITMTGGTRVSTGITGLDELLRGGIPGGHAVLVAGGSGTGKTILALQYLASGALSHGERGIFLSYEEYPAQIYNNARAFGWDLEQLEREQLVKVSYSRPVEICIDEEIIRLGQLVEEMGATRVVIDSLPALMASIGEEAEMREKIYCLINYLGALGCTTLFLSNPSCNQDNEGFGIEESLVNGTIFLKSTMEKNRRTRYLEVYKMRGTNHITGNHSLEITSEGIKVYPRTGEVV